ncbi:MAG: alternative ribosome rescue aminoacyl-tRNA hydrolase ArfB [Acidobacteriota bacterium]
MIEINDEISIPDSEIEFTASRSAGPGGQNVNKVNSRITVTFDVVRSAALNDEQKSRVLDRLKTRISRAGILQISSQKHRTQLANREAAVARFAELVAEALREERPRKKSRPSRAAREKRIEEKKRRSGLKRDRGRIE